MDISGPRQRPHKPLEYVLPKTSRLTFPALHYDENRETDFFADALMNLGQADGELARQLVAVADRWAREDFPEDDQEHDRSNARNRYINMGLFIYKALERQGLISYFDNMLTSGQSKRQRKNILTLPDEES